MWNCKTLGSGKGRYQYASNWNLEQGVLWSLCGIIWFYSGNHALLKRQMIYYVRRASQEKNLKIYFLATDSFKMIWKLTTELTGMLSRNFLFFFLINKNVILDWAVWFYSIFSMTLQDTVIQQSYYTLVLLQNLATYTTTANSNKCMQSNWEISVM